MRVVVRLCLSLLGVALACSEPDEPAFAPELSTMPTSTPVGDRSTRPDLGAPDASVDGMADSPCTLLASDRTDNRILLDSAFEFSPASALARFDICDPATLTLALVENAECGLGGGAILRVDLAPDVVPGSDLSLSDREVLVTFVDRAGNVFGNLDCEGANGIARIGLLDTSVAGGEVTFDIEPSTVLVNCATLGTLTLSGNLSARLDAPYDEACPAL